MVKVSSEYVYDEYIEAIGRRFTYSNCYFKIEELREWIAEGIVQGYSFENSWILTIRKNGFIKLYFLADTFDWTDKLPEIKKSAGGLDVVVEIVTRGNLDDYDLRKYFPFENVIRYDRLRSKGIEVDINKEPISYAKGSDFTQLRDMMDKTFQPIGDYIPSDKELDEFLSGENIICMKEGCKIEGFIIYEDKGKTSYIRMVCVSEDVRGRGLGERLMKMYFAIHQEYKGFTLWCRIDNAPAMKLYEKVGRYSNEDLHNYVFVV